MSRFCTQCGHQLGIGRYCTNCGARVAESLPAPETDLLPMSARYPLFADTAPSPDPVAPSEPGPVPAPQPAPPYVVDPPRRRRPAALWPIALLLLTAIAVTGVLLVVLGPSGDDEAKDDPTVGPRNPVQPIEQEPPPAPDTPLRPADVDVPGFAPPSVDGAGERVTFTPANLLDADPTTSWRMAGDGTGSVITFSFDNAVTVTQVGLVNGYAKVDPPHDWYAGNRRITEVVWAFDDGTEVPQQLEEEPVLQTIPVEPASTTAVELRIVAVTPPGEGPDARDYTAISDIEISGRE